MLTTGDKKGIDQPVDGEFMAIAEEMLACYREGTVDCNSNFDSPYDYGSMRYGAWCAGYAKALEDS